MKEWRKWTPTCSNNCRSLKETVGCRKKAWNWQCHLLPYSSEGHNHVIQRDSVGKSFSVADALVLSSFWSSWLRLERFQANVCSLGMRKGLSDSCCFAVIASSLCLFSQATSLVLPHSCQFLHTLLIHHFFWTIWPFTFLLFILPLLNDTSSIPFNYI